MSKVKVIASLNFDLEQNDGTRATISPSGYSDTVVLVLEDPVDVSVEVLGKDALIKRFPFIQDDVEGREFLTSLRHEI